MILRHIALSVLGYALFIGALILGTVFRPWWSIPVLVALVWLLSRAKLTRLMRLPTIYLTAVVAAIGTKFMTEDTPLVHWSLWTILNTHGLRWVSLVLGLTIMSAICVITAMAIVFTGVLTYNLLMVTPDKPVEIHRTSRSGTRRRT